MDANNLSILLVEDNPGDARLIRELLTEATSASFNLQVADRLAAGLARLSAGGSDAVLLDLSLPDSQGLDTLARVRAHVPHVPIVVLTGHADETLGIQLVQGGAQDYLIKGQVDGNLLSRSLRYAIERKRAEEALQAQRNFALQVLNAMGQGLTTTDADGRFEYVNPAYARMVGHAPKDLVGKRPQDVTAPEDHAVLSREYTRRQAGESSTYETRLKHINGQHVPVLITAVPRWRESKADGAIAVITDLTERKRAEEALQASEARFRGLFETMSEGVILIAPDGQIVQANPAAECILGLARSEITARNYVASQWKIIRPDGTPMPPEEMAGPRAMKEKRIVMNVVMGMEYPDGSISWINVSAAPLINDKGELEGVVGTFGDITDRKRAEQVVRDSEERLRALVESASDAIVSADSRGNIISWNKGAERMFGYREEEILGKSPTVLMPERYIEGYRRETQRMSATGELPSILGKKIEVHGIRKDGSEFPLELSLGLWETHEGRFSTVILRDVTERKRAEEEIRQSAARAEALARTAARLSAQLDLDATLNAVCEQAASALNAAGSLVYLYDEKRDVFSAVASVGVLPEHRARMEPIPRAVYESFMQRSDGINIIPDIQQVPYIPNAETMAAANLRTVVGTTILRQEKYVGLLTVSTVGSPRQFSEEELALLKGIADQAGLAITNARLFEETNRRVQHLRALRDIDQAITASLDLRVTLGILLDQVVVQLHVDAADILLFNPSLHTLEYVAGRGFHSRGIERSALRLGQGHAGRIVLERRSLTIHNLAETSEFVRAPLIVGEGFVSYIGVPLIAKGEVRGVLEIFQRSQLDPDPEWLNFLQTLAGQAAIALDNMQLFDGLQRSNADLRIAYDATIEGWSRALDLRDKETEGHTQRVTEMMEQLARSMGISEGDLVHVRRGALLHDIGKMGVPDSILLKPDKLTDEEWVSMRRHPIYAYEMLAPITYLRPALDIPYCHHERWDGTGYPRGLKGEQIPLVARMFAVIDVWDALRSDRLYRPAWSEEEVREHIRAGAGTHFDPKVVEAFLQMVAKESG